jgi:hypothetical protein
MKNLLLFLLFNIATILSAFAQGFIPKKIAPELKSFELNSNPDFSTKNDSIDFEKFYFSPPKNNSLHLPETIKNYPLLQKKLNLDLTRDQFYIVQNSEPVYTLRIVEPTGNHHMKIYEPDSSKNYTLLIKKF